MLEPEPQVPPLKVPFTAAVLVPPQELWPPIQAIRREHDPGVGRWMPHVTVLYPFTPQEHLDAAAEVLQLACDSFLSFPVTLGEFRCFQHGGRWATLWLHPDPPGPVERLQSELVGRMPWCEDTSRYESGYTPHLSVGRWPAGEAEDAAARLTADWEPLRWSVERLCLIARPESGEEPFRIVRELPFGGAD